MEETQEPKVVMVPAGLMSSVAGILSERERELSLKRQETAAAINMLGQCPCDTYTPKAPQDTQPQEETD